MMGVVAGIGIRAGEDSDTEISDEVGITSCEHRGLQRHPHVLIRLDQADVRLMFPAGRTVRGWVTIEIQASVLPGAGTGIDFRSETISRV